MGLFKKSQVQIAKKLAKKYHKGQFRWDGKTPYISHPAAVAKRVAEFHGDDDLIAAAWVHDIAEDATDREQCAADILSSGLNSRVILLLSVLTRYKRNTYLVYLKRIYNYGPDAVLIKKADIWHNLSCDPSNSLRKRYFRAERFLEFGKEYHYRD